MAGFKREKDMNNSDKEEDWIKDYRFLVDFSDEEQQEQLIEDDLDFVEDEEVPVKKKNYRRRFIIFIIIFSLLIIFINVGLLFFKGRLWFNNPDKIDYPVRGITLDAEYGKVDWNVISSQNLSFVYFNATKGTAFKDEQFDDNWKNSKNADLLTGAYHKFNLTKDGEEQAEYFSDSLGKSIDGRLIPAVEVKITGFYKMIPPEKQKVVKNLKVFCEKIEKKYKVKPLIICNNRSYEKYLSEDFGEYSIWIDSYFSEPDENIQWSFWGYTPRMKFRGYENKDEYVTLAIFNNTMNEEDFKKEFVL